MRTIPPVVAALAECFLAGEQGVNPVVDRTGRMLGRRWRWLRPLARRFVETFNGGTRPSRRHVAEFLLADAGFAGARAKYRDEIAVAQWRLEPHPMQPVPAAQAWEIPAIESPGALADWLGLKPAELDWFADLKGLSHNHKLPHVGHYRYRVTLKRSGGLRLIEAPKPRLKELQRRILSGILNQIAPHPAAHGFLKRRSIRTFVAPHAGQRVVVRMDLQDFFPTFPAARIQALFRTLGYPDAVAALLAGICTNRAPHEIWKEHAKEVDPAQRWQARQLYGHPHLPQGAPTSPALANACAYRLDRRLTGLAESAGAQYTRYADDLAFSGGEEFERCVERFATHVDAILHEEGFAAHHRKTRIMRQSVRQRLAGLVANQRINVPRRDFDRLKAILTNCGRFGPDSQNPKPIHNSAHIWRAAWPSLNRFIQFAANGFDRC